MEVAIQRVISSNCNSHLLLLKTYKQRLLIQRTKKHKEQPFNCIQSYHYL